MTHGVFTKDTGQATFHLPFLTRQLARDETGGVEGIDRAWPLPRVPSDCRVLAGRGEETWLSEGQASPLWQTRDQRVGSNKLCFSHVTVGVALLI